ncbi:hypothetical protein ACIBEJ_05650 [Nonomuraea sp. NPDC050790]|uniref:hypothetical protein n=1 Tax=Nonomuraea sp. NPDC050790 TaxID=3364371 RepID=UPI0037AB2D6F
MRMIWLCGPSGVGKTATGFEVFTRLGRDGVPAAYVDTDQISLIQPPPASTHRVRAAGLAALRPVFEAAGARWLVVSGYADTATDVRAYAPVLAADALQVRLRAGERELRRRYLGRGWLPDLVEDALAEARSLETSGVGGLVLDTDGLSVAEAAEEVLRLAQDPATWPGPAPQPRPAPAAAGGGEVLWLCGARGSGVSTAGYEVFRQMVRSGPRTAYVDLRQIGFLHPGAGQDVTAETLAALWSVHRAAGAERLVVAAGPTTPRLHARALPGSAITVCRLDATPATLTERLRLRAQGQGPAIPGDDMVGRDPHTVAEQAARQAEHLQRGGVGDLHTVTDGRTPQQVAADILARIP